MTLLGDMALLNKALRLFHLKSYGVDVTFLDQPLLNFHFPGYPPQNGILVPALNFEVKGVR